MQIIMRSLPRLSQAHARRFAVALVAVGASLIPSAGAQLSEPSYLSDDITPRIDAVLDSTEVQRHIRAWGLTIADVQHDLDAMSSEDRARLAELLTRRWRGTGSHSAAALKAQFLVMTSLMRESTLFARVIATRPARLLR
jgi:hypothetical protein